MDYRLLANSGPSFDEFLHVLIKLFCLAGCRLEYNLLSIHERTVMLRKPRINKSSFCPCLFWFILEAIHFKKTKHSPHLLQRIVTFSCRELCGNITQIAATLLIPQLFSKVFLNKCSQTVSRSHRRSQSSSHSWLLANLYLPYAWKQTVSLIGQKQFPCPSCNLPCGSRFSYQHQGHAHSLVSVRIHLYRPNHSSAKKNTS